MLKKKLLITLCLTLVLSGVLVLPAVLVTALNIRYNTAVSNNELDSKLEDGFRVKVYLSKEKRVCDLSLEDYVVGVVASEVPANFYEEALKAQALAARTYIYNRMLSNSTLDAATWGAESHGALVSDTTKHQVYSTNQALEQKWGGKYQDSLARIQKAVNATKNQILTYNGAPIYAAFFSTSNGRTENSEDYFSHKYPYLRSVGSEWDRRSPEYNNKRTISVKEAIALLESKTSKKVAFTASKIDSAVSILKRTDGRRVASIRIGDQIFTGRAVREALNLPSSDFTCEPSGNDKLTFATYGYGHGVGMSQWGANLMAQSGKSATDIVKHYYSGVEIQDIDKLKMNKSKNEKMYDENRLIYL